MFCKSLEYAPYLATEISEVIALLLALCQSLVKESQTANLATSNMNPLIFMVLYMQIPLGVLLHNENKLDEMGKILAHYMKLVPTVEAEGHLRLPNGSVIDFDDTRFSSILFGGDQLTVARIRGTQALRDTQARRVDRFEGVVPVVEDWHSRMTLMKVS